MKKLALIIALIPFLLKSQSALESEFLKQLNSYRDSLGLSTLEYDSNLSIATKYHVDYLVLVTKTGKKFIDSKGDSSNLSHCQSIDLPGFKEILECDARVSLLTNFKIAERIKKVENREYTSFGEVITGVKGNLRPGKKSSSIDLNDNKYLIAKTALESFKKSKGHNFVITDPGKTGMKVGISIREGLTPDEHFVVVVYGYPKN
jgi:uncharacterized protein YkwD